MSRPLAWLLLCIAVAGCATPQYAVRGTPTPVETQSVRQIEQAISNVQARGFEQQAARPIGPQEELHGFRIAAMVERLARVTERPYLPYRAYLVHDKDPNAAALADGRIYLTTGMINELATQPQAEDQLAFVIAHELAHTVAQHLVQRYRKLQQQQALMALAAAAASAATRNAGPKVQQAGRLALDAASMLNEVALSGFSQEQELEADQLGIRYVIRAGYQPQAALALLDDFARQHENPSPFLRTHPYAATRRAHLSRYLAEAGADASTPAARAPATAGRSADTDARIRQLREIQRLYPPGSVSWQNLQRQIDALERGSGTR